jgi:hypothetical protein
LALLHIPSGVTGAQGKPEAQRETATEATIVNFDRDAPVATGYPYGAQVVKLDEDGNALDAKSDYIAYFGNFYYLYGESYGCAYAFFNPTHNFCGFRVYKSSDLIHWISGGKFIDPATSDVARSYCQSIGCWGPVVVYNRATRKYVLWFYRAIGEPTKTPLVVMQSDSPAGPWVDPVTPAVPTGFAHDVFIDEDGSAYLVWGGPSSGIQVQKLNGSYTDVEGEVTTVTRPLGKISDAACQPPGGFASRDFQEQSPVLLAAWKACGLTESPSILREGNRYYLTFSDPICGFCLGTGTSYFVASSPLGPWQGRGGSPSFDPEKPGKFDAYSISSDSCGGQPFHVAHLPIGSGKRINLYTAVLWENSRNEGSANHYWETLRFSDGLILQLRCTNVTIPLAQPAPIGELTPRAINLAAVAAGSSLIQTLKAPAAGVITSVEVTIYQKAAPALAFGDEGLVSEPLSVKLTGPGGHAERLIAPADVSWSPTRVRITTDVSVRRGDVLQLTLSSATPRGRYATLFDNHDPYSEGRLRATGAATGSVSSSSDLLFVAAESTANGPVSFGSQRPSPRTTE